jgi:mono/diheme cytochrome c family protein
VTRGAYWGWWGGLTLVTSAYFGAVLTTETVGSKTMFLPGTTTAGHYQIEAACASCHTPFGGVTDESCLACHGEELQASDDSHPRSKFTDPRNAELVERLDATTCVTCHGEHSPDRTRSMGVTLPDDYCFTCHSDIAEDRPSHNGLAFTTCASAGCHNYHDNTALYEDFLVAHAGEPPIHRRPQVPLRSRPILPAGGSAPEGRRRLAADAPPGVAVERQQLARWEAAGHALAGVNCTECHTAASGPAAGQWMTRPGERECASCHGGEVDGFFDGRHGMRVAAGLGRMTPAMARLPMKREARGRELSCVSCHTAHEFDTRRAAVQACLGCHEDEHSTAYLRSSHYALWTREQDGTSPPGTGVSCATCHLPRQPQHGAGEDAVTVQHNQNANLRPNEKMIRTVCSACHGLGFSLDALADRSLVASNFRGKPLRSVAGIDMATTRIDRSPH